MKMLACTSSGNASCSKDRSGLQSLTHTMVTGELPDILDRHVVPQGSEMLQNKVPGLCSCCFPPESTGDSVQMESGS